MPPVADQVSLWGAGVSAPRTGCRNNNAFLAIRSVTPPSPHRRKIKNTPPPLSFRGLTPESRSWCKIIMSLWDNGDHPAPVILVFRNRPILTHNNKKYDCSGVARVRSHCMAPISACAGMTIRAHQVRHHRPGFRDGALE